MTLGYRVAHARAFMAGRTAQELETTIRGRRGDSGSRERERERGEDEQEGGDVDGVHDGDGRGA